MTRDRLTGIVELDDGRRYELTDTGGLEYGESPMSAFAGEIRDQAQRALLVMLANVGEGPGKMRICHVGHGDQEVVREIHRLHCEKSCCAASCRTMRAALL